MPRGSELYPPWSHALLRVARMGQVTRSSPRPVEDEKELGDDEDAEGDVDTGFVTTKWSQVPKDQEHAEPEFLAKRRKGLPSVHVGSTALVGTTVPMRKTTVKKIDAEGNPHFVEVLVPEGIPVEGEISENGTVPTEVVAPGTVIEGWGVANAEGVIIASEVVPTPTRRRPPPPKRKPKGPGRGRKKKQIVAVGADGAGIAIDVSNTKTDGGLDTNGLLLPEDSNQGGTSTDVEMQDAEDGDDASDDEDEEGEEGDEADREEGELTDADGPNSIMASPSKPPPQVVQLEPPSISIQAPVLFDTKLPPHDNPTSPDLHSATAQHAQDLTSSFEAPQNSLPEIISIGGPGPVYDLPSINVPNMPSVDKIHHHEPRIEPIAAPVPVAEELPQFPIVPPKPQEQDKTVTEMIEPTAVISPIRELPVLLPPVEVVEASNTDINAPIQIMHQDRTPSLAHVIEAPEAVQLPPISIEQPVPIEPLPVVEPPVSIAKPILPEPVPSFTPASEPLETTIELPSALGQPEAHPVELPKEQPATLVVEAVYNEAVGQANPAVVPTLTVPPVHDAVASNSKPQKAPMTEPSASKLPDAEEDLLGNLERHLDSSKQ